MRAVVPDDALYIVPLLKRLWEESPTYSEVDYDPDYVEINLRNGLEASMFGVISDNNDGFMLGSVGATWYSNQVNAYEQVLYIAPESRGGFLAARLICWFELFAEARMAKYVYAGASTGIQDDRTEALYIMLGYKRHGKSLRKALNV